MKKWIFSMMIFAFGISAMAQTADSISPADSMKLLDVTDPQTESGKQFLRLQNAVYDNQKAIQKSLKSEFNRYKIKYTLGINGKKIDSTNEKVSLSAFYQAIIEPNFRNDEQIRRDVWVVGAGLLSYLGFQTEVRITFSRVFAGENAKMKALMALPYFLDHLPMSSDKIKSKLEVGDSVRIEIYGSLSAGFAKDVDVVDANGGNWEGGGSYAREALFMVDIYRHSALLARLRQLVLRNRGKVNLWARAKLLPFDDLLGGRIGDAFKIGVDVSFTKTFDLLKRNLFPVETIMTDYLFKLDSSRIEAVRADTAEAAIDEIMGHFGHFGFLPLFKLIVDDKELKNVLAGGNSISERLVKEDTNKGNQFRVRHFFKGSIDTNFMTLAMGANFSELLKARNSVTFMTTFVTSEDSSEKKKYYLLESATQDSYGKMLFGRMERNTVSDVDNLMSSDAKKNIGGQLDLVISSEIRDKSFDAKELSAIQKSFETSLPPVLQTPELISFLPKSDQRNALYHSRVAFGADAYGILSNIDSGTVVQALYKFFENHPARRYMNLPCDEKSERSYTLSDYVVPMGLLLHQALGAEFSPKDRLNAFRLLLRDDNFRTYVLNEFLIRFIPNAKAEKSVGIAMHFASEQTPAKELTLGQNSISSVYQFVTFLKTLLHNRSYDLRLETITTAQGEEIYVSSNLDSLRMPLGD